LCKIHGKKGISASVQNIARGSLRRVPKKYLLKIKSGNRGFTGEKLKCSFFRDMFRRR